MTEHFNYIAFGNRDYIRGDVRFLAMNRGRMFEYTPSDLEKRLENLDTNAITFLEKLPTFLCSEIELANNELSMLVKYGYISEIKSGRREVSTTFQTLINFGEVNFEDVDHAAKVFGTDRYQLYRTHWAVREADPKKIIDRLMALKPEIEQSLHAEELYADDGVQPPPREKKILGVAENVESFLSLLYGAPAKPATETFFRGQSKSSYELIPSLLRKWDTGDWQFLPREDHLCKELLIAHYEEFQSDQYCFDRLVRMQHYGLPTRLLDVSGNPLVALYFACVGSPEELAADGEVIVFEFSSSSVKYYDSDTVSCLSNLSNLNYNLKNEINLMLELDEFNKTNVAGKLFHHIKSEKSYFERRIVPDDLGSVIYVKAKQTNSRIKSQSGSFLLFGHEATLPDAGREGIEISRITIRNKDYIRVQLDRININATTVYPSIDRTAVHLRDQYKMPRPIGVE